MTFCAKCKEIETCAAGVSLGGQARYFDIPKYQNEQWLADFTGFLRRLESFGCTNEQTALDIEHARLILAQVEKSILASA